MPKHKKYKISKKLLESLYLKKKMSIASIAKEIGCSRMPVHQRLIEFGIRRRNPWEENKIDINVEKVNYLYTAGKSINQIADDLGVSYSKIRTAMIENNVPRRDKIEISLSKPILKPSKTLCYLLGVLKGDGFVYKNQSNHYIVLESIDMPFIISFKNALSGIGLTANKIHSRKRNERCQRIHKISVGSKLFFNWYKTLNIEKTKSMILEANGEIDFIRGVYESEGSFFLAGGERPTLTIASTNKELMLLMKKLTENLGFSPTCPKPQLLRSKKPYYKLYFNKQKEIRRFIGTIKPCIKKIPVYKRRKLEVSEWTRNSDS